MRLNHSFLLLIVIQFFAVAVQGQVITGNGPTLQHTRNPSSPMSGPPVGPRDVSAFTNLVNINGQDGFYLKKDLYLTDTYTLINGRRVLGVPYLFQEWLEGSLTTTDGREYKEHKLRYNVQNQTVAFLNRTDSLDVSEEIKEFTLKYVVADSSINIRFVNSNQYQKGKTFYYEVLVDGNKGQLLMTNNKVITAWDNNSTILNTASTKKYLKLESEFYFYDKNTKKIIKITPSTDLRSLLKLTDQEVKDFELNFVDLTNEADLIKFFKAWSGKKAF